MNLTFWPPVLISATPGAILGADTFGAIYVDPKGRESVLYGPGHWTSYDSGAHWAKVPPQGWLHMLPDTGWAGESSQLSSSGHLHGLGAIGNCAPADKNSSSKNLSAWVASRNTAWKACNIDPPTPLSPEWLTSSPSVGYNYVNSTDGKLWSSAECQRVQFRGIPKPLNNSWGMCDGFTQPTKLNLADGSILATFPLVFAGEKEPMSRNNQSLTAHKLPMSLVVFRSVDGGFTWDYLSTAANYTQIPGMPANRPNPNNLTHSVYGPQENSMALLSDNKTIVIIFRPDTDSMCPGGPVPYKYYYQVYSHDGGHTWTHPVPVNGVGCVRPRLTRLQTGPLLMTGGRLCPGLVPNTSFAGHGCLPQSADGTQGGMFLWANLDGMADAPDGTGKRGQEWETYCLGKIHNGLWKGDAKYLFTNCSANDENCGSETYNSIVPLGPSSVGVFYQSGYMGPASSTWMMRVDIV